MQQIDIQDLILIIITIVMDELTNITNECEILLNKKYSLANDLIKILRQETIVKEKYFVFFYNSAKYLDSENISYALAGNAPVIFDRTKGLFIETGTARPIAEYIEAYERSNL